MSACFAVSVCVMVSLVFVVWVCCPCALVVFLVVSGSWRWWCAAGWSPGGWLPP